MGNDVQCRVRCMSQLYPVFSSVEWWIESFHSVCQMSCLKDFAFALRIHFLWIQSLQMCSAVEMTSCTFFCYSTPAAFRRSQAIEQEKYYGIAESGIFRVRSKESSCVCVLKRDRIAFFILLIRRLLRRKDHERKKFVKRKRNCLRSVCDL